MAESEDDGPGQVAERTRGTGLSDGARDDSVGAALLDADAPPVAEAQRAALRLQLADSFTSLALQRAVRIAAWRCGGRAVGPGGDISRRARLAS